MPFCRTTENIKKAGQLNRSRSQLLMLAAGSPLKVQDHNPLMNPYMATVGLPRHFQDIYVLET